MSDLVAKIRKNISNVGGSELKAIATNDGLRELWQSKQDLLVEMNRAKKLASEAAAKPYLDLIYEIEEQYAVLLQFIGDNKE